MVTACHECNPYNCVSTFAFHVRHDFHIHDSSRILILAEIICTVINTSRKQFLKSNICARISDDTNVSLRRFSFYFFFVIRLHRAHTKRNARKCAHDRVRIATRNCYAQIFDVVYSRAGGSLPASRKVFFSSSPLFSSRLPCQFVRRAILPQFISVASANRCAAALHTEKSAPRTNTLMNLFFSLLMASADSLVDSRK